MTPEQFDPVHGSWHNLQCFGCGPDNPYGLGSPFPFDTETGEVHLAHQPREHQQGAPGFVHGGILASFLDEAQGALCFHVGYMIMTDQLHLKYHVATPLSRQFHVRAWITAVRKRRLYTRGTIVSPTGELHVSSSAAFYILPERLGRKMLAMEPENARFFAEQLEANRKRAREIRRKLREAKAKARSGA